MVMQVTAERLWRVYVRDGGCCVYCGRAMRVEEVRLDHDGPALAADAVAEDRLSCACAECGQEKGDRTGAEYRSLRRQMHAREMLYHLAGGAR